MNSKLVKWAEALNKYYFGDNQLNKICLSISKNDLSAVYSHHEYYAKFPDKKVDYLKDFACCFKEEIPHPLKNKAKAYRAVSKRQFTGMFQRVIQKSACDGVPYFLPYIALFIMPINDEDIVTEERRLDRYYDYLDQFTEPLDIKIKEANGYWRFNFTVLRDSLQQMWALLENWSSQSLDSRWQPKTFNTRYPHIGPFFSECILNASQKKRFPRLFKESGLQPDSIISVRDANAALEAFGKEILGYSSQEWANIQQDVSKKDILVEAFYSHYDEWHGESRILRRVRLTNGQVVEQEASSGTTIGIRLIYNEHYGEASFCFKAYKKDFSEDIEFPNGKVLGFRRSGWGKWAFSDNAITFLESPNRKIELINTEEYTGNFHKVPVYIFEKESDGTWATINRIKRGEDYLIMIPPQSEKGLMQWITNNNGSIVNVEGLPQGYSLYLVQNIIEGYAEIPALRIRPGISIELTSGVVLNNCGYDLTLSTSKPVEFEVDGISVSETSMEAVFDDGSKVVLNYNTDTHKWRLNSLTSNQMGCPFRIEINGNRSHERHNYTIVEPDINIVNLPSKNIYGQVDNDGCFNGLNSSYTIDNFVNNLSRDGEIPECCEIYEHQLDKFIYDLSATSHLNKDQFKRIMNQHLKDEDDAIDWFELVSDLDKNGYVEMTYTKETGLYINPIPPTLVMVPVNFQKENMMGLTMLKPKDYCYRGIILGGRSKKMIDKLTMIASEIGLSYDFESRPEPLMPVTISLYSRNWSAFKKIASELGLIFKENSFYCASVIERIPNISDYLNNVVLSSSPTYKYSPDYRTSKGFKCFDYRALAENFNRRLSGERSFNRFLKSSFNPELDLVQYQEDIILWYNGHAYNVDRYWGHFLVCSLMGITDIIQSVPGEPDTICLPSAIKLPTLIARALTLVTGKLPYESNGIRTYQLANNPCMSCLEAEAIKRKLLYIQ